MNNNNLPYLLTVRDSEIKLASFPEYSLGFVDGIDKRYEYEMQLRGYCGHVYIVNKIKNIYFPLIFYDLTRLAQEMEYDEYMYEVGLIVVKKVTKNIIIKTSKILLKNNYLQKNQWFSKEELSKHYYLHLFKIKEEED
jgi:hypothetical protein